MLRAIGEEFLSRLLLGSVSLLYRDVDASYETTLFQRLTHLSDIIERLLRPTPDVQALLKHVRTMIHTAQVRGITFDLRCSHKRTSEFVSCWPNSKYELGDCSSTAPSTNERSAPMRSEFKMYFEWSIPSVYDLIRWRLASLSLGCECVGAEKGREYGSGWCGLMWVSEWHWCVVDCMCSHWHE